MRGALDDLDKKRLTTVSNPLTLEGTTSPIWVQLEVYKEFIASEGEFIDKLSKVAEKISVRIIPSNAPLEEGRRLYR
jgi:hypothetical protein